MIKGNIKDFVKPVHYYLFQKRKVRNMWGGAFNGQEIRRKIFLETNAIFKYNEVYETGTFRGNTAAFMHENSDANIFTVEARLEFYRYSRMRFMFKPKVRVYLGDSRSFLRDNVQDSDGAVFFYLDAHWEEDLPLGDEAQIIFGKTPNAIIMIDDFKVEGDPGYSYDDYGNGKTLHLPYLYQHVKTPFFAFFPISSAQETGIKRGSVILTNNEDYAEKLKTVKYLRMWEG